MKSLIRKLKKIQNYYVEMNNSGFDFEFDINDSNDFLRIGRNNTGTEISLCKNYPDSGGRPLVAWLDSEGAVNSIFATSIADFFQVFPYLNGMVYDILFKLHAHCKYPANIVSPDNYYTTEVVSNYLKENLSKHPFLTNFMSYLRSEGISLGLYERPYPIIKDAYNKYPSFEIWYMKRNLNQ